MTAQASGEREAGDRRSAIAICCLNSAARLMLADQNGQNDAKRAIFRHHNTGQCVLLNTAADLADELLLELKRTLARFERCAASQGNHQDVIADATEQTRAAIAKASGLSK